MTVVCGTDFSDHAGAAARVAAAMASRLGVAVQLVHVIDGPQVEPGRDGRHAAPRDRLAALADELRAEIGVEVQPVIEWGAPDEVLVALAGRSTPGLLVVGTLGQRKQHRWLLGSVAERAAQSSSVPVLVVREGAGIESWARGGRALRVGVAVDRTPSSECALRWARGLRAIGPCDIAAVQIVWPAEEHHRLGLGTPVPLDHLRPDLAQQLLAELEKWAGEPEGTSFVVRPGWGRIDGHLAHLASELDLDLLVVGTHQRAGVARLWQGSVSRGVLHAATMSVACVPRSDAADAG